MSMKILEYKSYFKILQEVQEEELELFSDTMRMSMQSVSRLVDMSAGGDFLCLCDQKSSCKRVPDFGRLRSYGHF